MGFDLDLIFKVTEVKNRKIAHTYMSTWPLDHFIYELVSDNKELNNKLILSGVFSEERISITSDFLSTKKMTSIIGLLTKAVLGYSSH